MPLSCSCKLSWWDIACTTTQSLTPAQLQSENSHQRQASSSSCGRSCPSSPLSVSPAQGPARWNSFPASLWITDIIRGGRKPAGGWCRGSNLQRVPTSRQKWSQECVTVPVVSKALGFEAVLSSCVWWAELTNDAEPGLGLPCSFTSCYSPAFVRPASSSRPGVSKAALRLSSPTWEVQEETHPSRLSVRSLSLHFSWKPKRAAMLSFNLSLSALWKITFLAVSCRPLVCTCLGGSGWTLCDVADKDVKHGMWTKPTASPFSTVPASHTWIRQNCDF